MLGGLDDFDGRVPLRSWLFGILVDRARSARDSGRRPDRYADSLLLMGLAWYFRASWVLLPTPWSEQP